MFQADYLYVQHIHVNVVMVNTSNRIHLTGQRNKTICKAVTVFRSGHPATVVYHHVPIPQGNNQQPF